MIDILGREIKVGDIVAHATRSGNSGAIGIKIIADARMANDRWGSGEHEEVKVINYEYITREYNYDTRSWYDVEPYYKKGGSGWSAGGTFVVINESVPDELKNFLRSLI